MPAQTPIQIAQLVDGAKATLASKTEEWQADVGREIDAFVSFCAAAGLTQLPDDRLDEVAEAFLKRATTAAMVPSTSMEYRRKAAVRAVLRAGSSHTLLLLDPFAAGYDRVLAGQDFPPALRVKGYMPKGLPPEAWARVRPVFEDWVPRALAANPGLAYSTLVLQLSRHLVWCEREGIPLQPRKALDRAVIDRAVAARKMPANSATCARSILTRTGDALAPTFRLSPLGRPDRLDPYTEEDIDALVRWILSIDINKAAARAWEVLVFAAGVGFDVPAMRQLRGTHVSRRGEFVVVHDPDDRQHPVAFLPRWEEEGLRLAKKAKDGYLIHPALSDRQDKNLVAGIIHQLGKPPPRTPSFDTRRLRATWVLHHLRAGVAPAVLLDAAGLTSFSSLDRYKRFLEWPGDEDAFRMLRGGG